jgi:prevent-host-death family protein
MATVYVHEAKTHLSKLLQRAECGEEIIIARARKPVARLVPLDERPKRRPIGIDKGLVLVGPDGDDPRPGFEDYM